MTYSFFVDTTRCTACRGCQVACKQWHDLPAEETVNGGSHQNPPDLGFTTYKLVRMNEATVEGRLHWLFFPDQCRHCLEPPCLETAGEPAAIFRDDATGAVLYTAQTRLLNANEIIEACPYHIPRRAADNRLSKCDMCVDRVKNGLRPACVQTCPTGAMNFGGREEMLKLAGLRLATVRRTHPGAQLLDPDDVNVIYLTAFDPYLYHRFSVAASGGRTRMTRKMALKRIMRPLTRGLVRWVGAEGGGARDAG
jgi:formate dehydrogenase iron-sulfur subunit